MIELSVKNKPYLLCEETKTVWGTVPRRYQNNVFLCASYDGESVMQVKGRCYYQLAWLKKEFPKLFPGLELDYSWWRAKCDPRLVTE